MIPASAAALAPTTDIAAYITQAATKRGIDPSVALRVAKSEGGLTSWNLQSGYFKNGVQEQSFGPLQLNMDGGLGSAFQHQTGLDPRLAANGPAGVDFALDYASKNGWGSWYGARAAGIGNWQGIGGAKGANDASDALTKLAGSAGQATQGIGSLGSGVTQLATTLTGSSNRSGGSLLSELSSPNFTPNTTLGAVIGAPNAGQAQQSSSGLGFFGSILSFIPKLFHFADGTSSAPGGLAMVGERGRELVNLPRGSQVVPTHRTESLLAAAANSNGGGGRTKVDVGVSVDNNGNLQAYVKRVADERASEKVQGGLADYTDHMRQQGFGQIQGNYMAEKG